MSEIERIQSVYQKRIGDNLQEDRYSLFRPGELYMLQSREEATLKLLREQGWHSLRGKRILEIGCGRGQRLADLLRWGALPEDIHGIDLMEEFVAEARHNHPGFNITSGSADDLPFESGSFDLVYQSTVFTSILDDAMRLRIAQEMRRVMKPDGLLLWYDFRYPNPRNRDVRPVGRRELGELFQGMHICLRSVTLAPPIARRLARVSTGLCRMLEAIPPLRTHYLGVIRNGSGGRE